MRGRTKALGSLVQGRVDPGRPAAGRGFGGGRVPGFLIALIAAILFTPATGACRPWPAETEAPRAPEARWYKGQTHAHTLWDNGDALPELAADWYQSRGYDFVVLSDHNDRNALTGGERWIDVGADDNGRPSPAALTDLARRFGETWPVIREVEGRRQIRLKTFPELEAEFRKDPRFLLIPGEEIGDTFQGKLIHHNALNLDRILPPPGGGSVPELLARAVDASQAEGGRTGRRTLIHLNHLNLGWAVSAEDLVAVPQERFFEVYNGHPLAANGGDAGHSGTEALWDRVLTARLRSRGGPLLYGLATDDAHHYYGKGEARPGRGWIMVRAETLSAEALLRALDAGDFYGSTGVVLSDVVRDDCGLSVTVAPEPGATYTIRFIGTRAGGTEAGTVLQETRGTQASYCYEGDELYVRAVVTSDRALPDPTGAGECQTAWVQPARVGWTLDR